MNLSSIHVIPDLLHHYGIDQVVLSPGSRCAPLTIAFARHGGFTVRSISDERSAAFIGLGTSLGSGRPAVLVCTSGTAAANYGPAVIEAWYQQIPLIVLTADRPPEWIDQQDGQSIRQQQLFGNHVKGFYQFPVDTEHPDAQWHAHRIIQEAALLASAAPGGPVHINIPIREPFYPEGELVKDTIRLWRHEYQWPSAGPISGVLAEQLLAYKKIVIAVGQQSEPALGNSLRSLSNYGIPVIADVLSNQKEDACIHTIDILLSDSACWSALRPDLIITTGKSFLSKAFKQFIRTSDAAHWHLQDQGEVADPFKRLTNILRVSPEAFLAAYERKNEDAFKVAWNKAKQCSEQALSKVISHVDELPWSDVYGLMQLRPFLDSFDVIHLSNSMTVRYGSYLSFGALTARLRCNRGTSGIDGSISTAVGEALANPEKKILLIAGDLSFFYDRNAFWHNDLPQNLKVVVLNNQGGAIFNMIDGPARQPEAREYFVTRQPFSIAHTVQDTGAFYLATTSKEDFVQSLSQFLQASGLTFWEWKTEVEICTRAFQEFKKSLVL
jgi:2-succinyl-5-enolpyruvyl-6-hydroxy-3-cyclohexene-1-carboxylate synthase